MKIYWTFVLIDVFSLWNKFLCVSNSIGGEMVSVLASSAVDRGFEPRSGQPKDYKIGILLLLR